jgi:hypothetical protein
MNRGGIALVSGRVERRPHVANVENAARVDGYRHDVEATAHAVQVPPLEIVLGQTREASLLVPGDGGRRRLVPAGATTLDLDEDDHAFVAAHEIDLALAKADIPLDHGETGAFERPGGFGFSRLPEAASIVGHDARIAPPRSSDNVQSW